MASPTKPRPRIITVLAVLFAVESVTVTAVRAADINAARNAAAEVSTQAIVAPAPKSVLESLSRPGPVVRTESTSGPDVKIAPLIRPTVTAPAVVKRGANDARSQKPKTVKPARTVRPATTKPRTTTKSRTTTTSRTVHKTTTTHKTSAPRTTRYSGRNHVWIPTLGVNRSVSFFPCSRTQPPANYVYRWGCAGSNNVYLLGHAWGVFHPLNRAYYNGRLRVGMKVIYADSRGNVHTYSVQWWKVVLPTTSASWAWASLSRPSMTLQTCIGANSSHRLMVRLAQVS